MRNIASCATQARPSWNAVTVRLAGMFGRAQRQPGQVDREEARAAAACPRRRTRARPSASEATGYRPGLESRTAGTPASRASRSRTPATSPIPSCWANSHEHVGEPVAGMHDPLDEPEHEQHGDRVVEARLALERALQPLAQPGAAQQREHRGAVGRGDDRADQQALERREAEQPRGGQAGDDRGDQRARQREPDRRPQHRPDLAPAGGQPALEQDQGERDHADRLGEVGVVELDQAEAVGADRHAQAEEQHEAGQPHAPRDQRRGERRGQQGADDQDALAVLQARSISARATPASCRPARCRRRP